MIALDELSQAFDPDQKEQGTTIVNTLLDRGADLGTEIPSLKGEREQFERVSIKTWLEEQELPNLPAKIRDRLGIEGEGWFQKRRK